MKKVLIALDYDPTAQKIAETGFSLAKSMNAEVTLLHVISDPVYYATRDYSPIMGFNGYMDMGAIQKDTIEGLQEASNHFLEKTRIHLGDDSIKTIIKEGEFATAILKTAKEIHADIIVIGSHSQKWLEKIVMGSVTEKVLNNTSIPLFVVPTKKHK
ncbi:MAG: universal stress protein [Bacteroidales bacterium]